MADFEDHITTAFPEVRMKTFLEMRGADGGPWSNICALPAFWVGLLYDPESLEAVSRLVADISPEDVMEARLSASRDGLRGRLGTWDMHALAKKVVSLSEDGLRRRARLDDKGNDETEYLSPIIDVVTRGKTPADQLLELYNGQWQGDVMQVFESHQ